MNDSSLSIGWAVWACTALMAVTFTFWSRGKARAGQTYTWPTAMFGLFVWVFAIFFLCSPWNKLHLLWLLPTAFVGSSILFFAGIPIITPIVLSLTGLFMHLTVANLGIQPRIGGETAMPKCPECESKNVERVRRSVGAAPEGGSFAAATYKCRDCGNMFSDRGLKGER